MFEGHQALLYILRRTFHLPPHEMSSVEVNIARQCNLIVLIVRP